MDKIVAICYKNLIDFSKINILVHLFSFITPFTL